MKYLFFLFALLFTSNSIVAQNEDQIVKILEGGSPLIQRVVDQAEYYELQILYSQITRDEDGNASIRTYKYGVDPARYFYPASTVKMPVSFFALEKLNALGQANLTMDTPMAFGRSRAPQQAVFKDTTAVNGQITLAHLIKKVFLVSDNEAYNLLYAYCGQQFINEQLQNKGYVYDKITHRVGNSKFTMDDNRHANPWLFYSDNKIRFIEAAKRNTSTYDKIKLNNCIKGNGFYKDGKLISKPFDFCEKNFLSLPSLHHMLTAFIAPETVERSARYNIDAEQRRRLLSYMSARPRESTFPDYDESVTDSYVKFFMVGDQDDAMPEALRIFNKVGYAYGYLTDVAYITDLEAGVEFFLSATIHVNENGIYNDDTYEYQDVGIPFLAELGRLFYAHEKKRNYKFVSPELKSLTYD